MQVQDVSRLFRTLGDPTRLRLMRLMAAAELSVMELGEITALAQSRISNHLKVLREEGLVQERREGAWRYYRIDHDRLPETARTLWQPIREGWEEDGATAADAARLEEVLARRRDRDGRFFETIADRWDEIRDELFGDSITRAILRLFVSPDLVVADIGSGTGYMIELLGDCPRRLIAIDNSDAMLSIARGKVEAYGLRNVELRRGDAHEPPLEDGEADLVTFVMVLHHLEEPARALANAAHALAPGGRLMVCDFVEHQEAWLRETMEHRHLGFGRRALEESLADAGLTLDAWSVLPGRPWTTDDGRKVQIPNGFAAVARRAGTQPRKQEG